MPNYNLIFNFNLNWSPLNPANWVTGAALHVIVYTYVHNFPCKLCQETWFVLENYVCNWSWLYEGHFSLNALSLKNVYRRLDWFLWSCFLCDPHVIRSCVEGPVFPSHCKFPWNKKRGEHDWGRETWNINMILENVVTNINWGAFTHACEDMNVCCQLHSWVRCRVNSAEQEEQQFSSKKGKCTSENAAAQQGPWLSSSLWNWPSQWCCWNFTSVISYCPLLWQWPVFIFSIIGSCWN